MKVTWSKKVRVKRGLARPSAANTTCCPRCATGNLLGKCPNCGGIVTIERYEKMARMKKRLLK